MINRMNEVDFSTRIYHHGVLLLKKFPEEAIELASSGIT